MITIALVWMYMFLVAGVIGVTMSKCLAIVYKDNNGTGIFTDLFLGVSFIAIYSQAFSIFSKIGLLSNIILLLICILCGIAIRKHLINKVKHVCEQLNVWKIIFIVASFLVLALVTAGAPMITDSYGYHAQTIRWIEEYGCVPGIANLISRLGFNSSIHSLNALFGFSFLFDDSLRVVTGWFSLALLLFSASRITKWKSHESHLADCMSLGAFVYVIIDTAWISSPITDTPANCLVFFILIGFIDAIERKDHDIFHEVLLCFLILFAATIKFSVIILVILALFPGYEMIKQKKIKQFFISIFIGIIIMMPFLIRNVIVSGWLLYPFYQIDLFHFSWKVSKDILINETNAVTTYARLPGDLYSEASSMKGLNWVSAWFRTSSISHKILYVFVGIAFLQEIILGIYKLIKEKKASEWVLFKITMLVGLVYWFLVAPHVRFGWGYLMFFLIVVPYENYQFGNKKNLYYKIMLFMGSSILLMYLGFYSLRTAKYLVENMSECMVNQADYIDSPEYETFSLEGMEFYLEKTNSPGYDLFPAISSETDRNKLNFIGNDISDGFQLGR